MASERAEAIRRERADKERRQHEGDVAAAIRRMERKMDRLTELMEAAAQAAPAQAAAETAQDDKPAAETGKNKGK